MTVAGIVGGAAGAVLGSKAGPMMVAAGVATGLISSAPPAVLPQSATMLAVHLLSLDFGGCAALQMVLTPTLPGLTCSQADAVFLPDAVASAYVSQLTKGRRRAMTGRKPSLI